MLTKKSFTEFSRIRTFVSSRFLSSITKLGQGKGMMGSPWRLLAATISSSMGEMTSSSQSSASVSASAQPSPFLRMSTDLDLAGGRAQLPAVWRDLSREKEFRSNFENLETGLCDWERWRLAHKAVTRLVAGLEARRPALATPGPAPAPAPRPRGCWCWSDSVT